MPKNMPKKPKKTKENAKSITGFWKLVNDSVPIYLDHAPVAKKKKVFSEIRKIEEEVNTSSVPDFISENFVSPFLTSEREKIKVVFDGVQKGAFGSWIVLYDGEQKTMKLNPVGIYGYSSMIVDSPKKLSKLSREEDFQEFRLHSFSRELSKLPEQYHIFLAILKGVAEITEVCISDSRGSAAKLDEHTFSYLTTLWALKQFEEFYQKFQNRSIRADFHLIWHEGEWVD